MQIPGSLPQGQAKTPGSPTRPASGAAPEDCFLPGAEECRQEAARRLQAAGLNASPRQIELGALELLEQSAQALPKGGPAYAVSALARLGTYTGALIASVGVGGPAAAALAQALEGFQPDRLWVNEAKHRAFGALADIQAVNKALAPTQELPVGEVTLRITGLQNETQLATLKSLMEELHGKVGDGVFRCLQEIHVRPFLGDSFATDPNQPRRVMGLAGTSEAPGVMALDGAILNSPDSARHYVFHELGHVLDLKMGRDRNFWTQVGSTPFGKTPDRDDSISAYARTAPWEDLAETHALLLENWDQIQARPDLWLHCNGAIGKKLAWILGNLYGREVPGPPPGLEPMYRGETCLGWRLEDGKTVGAERELGVAMREVLKQWRPGQTVPPSLVDPTRPGWEQRTFALQLAGASVPPFPEGYHPTRKGTDTMLTELKFLARLRTAPPGASPREKRGHSSHLDSTEAHLRRQLEQGGPDLRRAFEPLLGHAEADPRGPLHLLYQQLTVR